MVTLPATTSDVSEMLSSHIAVERLHRRKCLLKLLSNARFLTRQGLTFRGDGHEESDSNFMRLIHLHSEDNAKLVDWIKRKTDKTSGDMQNEMVKVMALRVLRETVTLYRLFAYFLVIFLH